MSLDVDAWKRETVRVLTIDNGMAEHLAQQLFVISHQALLRTNGGGKHYIPANRRTDKRAIREAYAGGSRVEQLARMTGLSQRRIREIITEPLSKSGG